jgi:hypothetical protein
MERLFSPCIRLYDMLENQGRLEQFRGRNPDVGLHELNLNVSTEELLSAERAFTYADVYATIGNEDTVAWLTPHTAILRNRGRALHAWYHLDESCRFYFRADGKEIFAMALSPEHVLEICDFVLRLLAVSVVHSLFLDTWSLLNVAVINATTLAYMMEQCQSLKVLTLEHQEMDEDHCRVLEDFSRPDLEIVLVCCKITRTGASVMTEVLGRNQGPTKLEYCHIDNSILAEGLRGNSRLKSFTPLISSSPEDSDRQVLAIAGALRENKGLVELNLACDGFNMNDEAWGAICNSLKAHPTLELLDLRWEFGDAAPAPVVLKSQIQALLDMMKVNMSIHTIHLNDCLSQHELFRGSVIPYLETNRFRPRLLAIQRTRPIPYRAKVLGRALLSARTDANRFWTLLSGNAEVAFPSRTTTIAAAANLPTPAAAATTTLTGSLPIAAATVSTATSAATPSTASTSDAFASTAAANAATPSAGQKRRACR